MGGNSGFSGFLFRHKMTQIPFVWLSPYPGKREALTTTLAPSFSRTEFVIIQRIEVQYLLPLALKDSYWLFTMHKTQFRVWRPSISKQKKKEKEKSSSNTYCRLLPCLDHCTLYFVITQRWPTLPVPTHWTGHYIQIHILTQTQARTCTHFFHMQLYFNSNPTEQIFIKAQPYDK